MIDSCDPKVACWSEDGETFVVKDPTKFEQEIIPQFFKHSKFSSFVRQLNFYSFRKIKYADTIRLDPKLEAETANFWRFRHENFQRGKPQLLTEIKRMTAAQSKAAAAAATTDKVSPDGAPSSNADGASIAASPQNQAMMKSEIDTLKKQLEEMNKNMSELTCMVQKVSLNAPPAAVEEPVSAGNKRKKVETTLFPESVPSTAAAELTDAALELFMEASPDDIMFANDENPMQMQIEAIPESQSSTRESSTATNMTDVDFVDQLFTVFGSDEEPAVPSLMPAMEDLPAPEPVGSFSYHQPQTSNLGNRPDTDLMERLSEALAVLPKEMQEQIVNRLIASIMSNKPTPERRSTVPADEEADDVLPAPTPDDDDQVIGMPLAAATLASLLSYYSNLVQEAKSNQDSKHNSSAVKTIPVIPCHA